MVDNLSILLTHGLLALAFWRLLLRADLDDETNAPPAGDTPIADTPREPARTGINRIRRNGGRRDA